MAGPNEDPVVLVVDDEPLNRDLLRRLLYHEYEVIEAEDALAAAAVLAEPGGVDLLLCDHLMPGKSGAQLAREVRVSHPRVVTVLLTGYEDAEEVRAAYRDGVIFEVLAKPWAAAELRETLARALEARRGRP